MTDKTFDFDAIAQGVHLQQDCARIANTIFPSNFDHTRRELLNQQLLATFGPIIARLTMLERDSHPPAALPIAEMQREIAELKERMAAAEAPIRVTVRPAK